MIMDTVLKKRCQGSKLRDMKVLAVSDWKELTTRLGRNDWKYVEKHWFSIIQPCLLKYFAGTLNLNINPLLVSYIQDNFQNSTINWNKVLEVKEFAGHTLRSISTLYDKIKSNTGERLSLHHSEVRIEHMKLHPGGVVTKSKIALQKSIIDYFISRTKDMSITDFV